MHIVTAEPKWNTSVEDVLFQLVDRRRGTVGQQMDAEPRGRERN